jgi:hypothetical protein
MIPIQDLLSRIRWDPMLAKGEFVIVHYDRIENKIVKLPFWRVHFSAGEHFSFEAMEDHGTAHPVPLHRLRDVWRNSERIWHRDSPSGGGLLARCRSGSCRNEVRQICANPRAATTERKEWRFPATNWPCRT